MRHFWISTAIAASILTATTFTTRSLAQTQAAQDDPNAHYELGADSQRHDGIPHGTVTELHLAPSQVYPGYTHKAWLYLPAKQANGTPLALMVFQDGGAFVAADGGWHVPDVLDNLIATNAIPPMAAVFVDPGKTEHDDGLGSEQRSLEYDSLSRQYADFLELEVLPAAEKYAKITHDPRERGIAGASSGGICAFTVAWQRSDSFSKVFSAIGSFVDIRGGGVYPDVIRAAPMKPIRVFLQDGAKDGLPNQFAGLDWPAGNRAMARALALRGYDFQLVMGTGTHNGRHGAAIFPAAMRWLWRDYASKP
jgi:enterochelin esterase-like enzyme